MRRSSSPRRVVFFAFACAAGLVCAAALLGTRGGVAAHLPPDWGAAAILHPLRKPVTRSPTQAFETVSFASGDVRLEGWLLRTTRERRGLVVYLHGIADNRQSGLGLAGRLLDEGWDVFTFDARAHGRSTGEACTYGYYERNDVSRALDAVAAENAVLLGHSLGAAVALQTAAVDTRVRAVVAASSFADVPSIVHERARRLLIPAGYAEAALVRAGERAHFRPAAASPVAAAAGIACPVLLLHGAADAETSPEHSQRISAALPSPHRLVLLAGVGHDEILGREEAWREIEAFLADAAAPAVSAGVRRSRAGGSS